MSGLFGFETNEKILDVSGFEDMSDLLLVADVLITDYSSCAGDFALTHRPIILYQSDRREYREKDRDFYFEMEDSPYMIAENQQELEDWISRLDEETVRKNCDEILRFYKTTESGRAADAAAGRIVEWLNEE
jgi:CDP-glycerol glycerophosphotransferase